MVGDNIEKYQKSLLYPYTDVTEITEMEDGRVVINIANERLLSFFLKNEETKKFVAERKENI